MLIGEASKLSGLPIETLRYYDRIGLICPQRKGAVRHYSESEIKRLQTVAKMKKLMFSLEEIQIILAADHQVDISLAAQAVDTEAMATLLDKVRAKHLEIEALQQSIEEVLKTFAGLIAKIEDLQEVKGDD